VGVFACAYKSERKLIRLPFDALRQKVRHFDVPNVNKSSQVFKVLKNLVISRQPLSGPNWIFELERSRSCVLALCTWMGADKF